MVLAYVLIKANTGEADRLKRSIGELDGVDRVSIVAGDIDLIAKVAVESPTHIKEIAADAIQTIDGVETTRTYIALE
jgi:DNA-binding Lrp family transcriptional regulator